MVVEITIFDLFLKATFFVKFILFILICLSVVSWTIIIQRAQILNLAFNEAEDFEEEFWSVNSLICLYQKMQKDREKLSGFKEIFFVGFKEFSRLCRNNSQEAKALVEGASRVMHITINRELEIIGIHIQFLGTIGSISPYIGLFGTVWGIMDSFIKIGFLKYITMQMIAPSITEALIATAVGLFTAIPAVIGYNYLNQRMMILEQNYRNFMEEFVVILHRQAFSKKS